MKNAYGLFLILLLPLASCRENPPIEPEKTIFRLSFSVEVGNVPFALQTPYEHINGQGYQLSRFRFLLSELALVDSNGDLLLLENDILVNPGERTLRTADSLNQQALQMTWEVPAGTYQGIRVNVGVPESRNNGNPAIYESSHPLSIRRNIHWDWSTGYKFMEIEGWADTLTDGIEDFNQGISMHPGTNRLFRELSWEDQAIVISEGEAFTQEVTIQVEKLFYNEQDTLDFRTEAFVHANPSTLPVAEQIMDNFTTRSLIPQ